MPLYAQNAGDRGSSGIHPRAPFVFDIYELYQRNLQKIHSNHFCWWHRPCQFIVFFLPWQRWMWHHEISRDINDELFCIQEWSNINKLSLNVFKTKHTIFHHRQRNIDEFIPDIRVNDSPIKRVTEFNFLDLQIGQHLNWNAHIQKGSNKISRTLGVMTRYKRHSTTKILRVLFRIFSMGY